MTNHIGPGIKNRRIWENLLKSWMSVMKSYIADSKDMPFWYDERANTGFLAAAAWKLEAVAIEEYCVERGYKKNNSQGRCDIWIKFRGKDNFNFSAEAKQLWPSSLKNLNKNIREKLYDAREQLISIPRKEKGKYQVCICFISPQLNKNYKVKPEEFIESIKENFKKENNLIIASYFPRLEEKLIKFGKYIYPGIILIARVLNSKSR